MSNPAKILVVRNDKLGDFMLSYPTFALLKDSLPDTEIHALVQPYTQALAELCPSIDKIQLDPGQGSSSKGLFHLTRQLRKQRYDAVITLYSTTRIALALALAGIPYRLAPATKIAQLFYTKRLKQRRSRSEKPEFIYNRDLAERYLQDWRIKPAAYAEPPFLSFASHEIKGLRENFIAHNNIAPDRKLVFIHPGSGGSANNLTLPQYAKLAHSLDNKDAWQLVISAGPAEAEQANQLATLTEKLCPIVYVSTAGLEQFTQQLAIADVFISGSTGPLHIAGALDRPTAAFYPRRLSATALRWQTLNSESHRLAFSPPTHAEAEDMQSIDIVNAAQQISQHYLLI